MAAAASSAQPPLSKVGVLRLSTEYVHDGRASIASLFAAAGAALGRSDFTQPIKILTSHLVESVSDLRLLIVENQLRELGLPIRLCVWIEEEVAKLKPADAAAGSALNLSVAAPPTPSSGAGAAAGLLPPIPLSAPVRPRHAPTTGAAGSAGAAAAAAAVASLSPAAALPHSSSSSALSSSALNAAAASEVFALFPYSSDFDERGVLFYLGSHGGSREWTNPAEAGLVSVSASGLGKDSAPLSSLVGRSLVRCVTNSGEGSFIEIELKGFMLRPTHYTFRHYASYDTECLRDWKLEGRNDPNHIWTLIKEHVGDSTLYGKGATHTWPINVVEPLWANQRSKSLPEESVDMWVDRFGGKQGGPGTGIVLPNFFPQYFFRYFRWTMLGPNSNAHNYLACSGVELYGGLISTKQIDAWKQAGSDKSGKGMPGWIEALGAEWPLPPHQMKQIQQRMLQSPAAAAGGAPAAGGAAAAAAVSPSPDDLNSTAIEDDDELAPLTLLSAQLAQLGLVDSANGAGGAAGGGGLHPALPLAQQASQNGGGGGVSSGLSALGSAGLFTYSSDFDKNGMIWALATGNNTRAWSNPLDNGYLRIHASSLMDDSVPLSALVARDTVRCVTKPIPNSWIVFDFLSDKRVWLTHYTFKHYSSWETECLRSWRVEASLTGEESEWVLLREHVKDENLTGKGGTFTWSVPSAEQHKPFRFMRIIQTGENSNKHHYLALSGVELYGRLLGADGATPFDFSKAVAVSPSPSPAAAPLGGAAAAAQPAGGFLATFRPRSDFDQNGLFHWLGTGGLRAPWRNPVEAGLVRASSSTLNEDSEPLSALVGHSVVRCVTQSIPDQWIALDLGPGRLFQPSAYSLRHYASWDTEALRNWRFQGSSEGGDAASAVWVTLLEHREDESLQGKGSTHTWALPPTTRFFRMFRISQYDKNSNKHHYLACSGWEMYGVLKAADEAEALRPIQGGAMPAHEAVQQPVIAQAARPSVALAPVFQPAAAALVPAPHAAAAFPASVAPALPPALGLDTWEPDAHGSFLDVGGAAPPNSHVRNSGSNDKWQLVKGTRVYSSGVQKVSLRVMEDPPTSNTWRFIVGVVPTTLDARGPKQWVGVSNSWGYISGTGGKCHTTATSLPYGAKFGKGDVVTMVMHFESRTLAFFKNDEPQGVAFSDLQGPVHVAASLTATGSALQIVATPPAVSALVAQMLSYSAGGAALPPHMPLGAAGPSASAASFAHLNVWDQLNKSSSLTIDPVSGVLRNSGSADKWQSCRSLRPFSMASGIVRPRFDVELVDAPRTNNSWQVIVGVVPPTFTCTGTKQWVGAGDSWGYIGGTGGKCFNVPKSIDYGQRYGAAGDVITVQLDFAAGTIEFSRNGVSQGVAFTNLTGTVYAAVSLTATGATARLRVHT